MPDTPTNIVLDNNRNDVLVMTGYTGGETPVQSSATTYEEFEAFAKDLFGDRADEYLAICKKDGADLEQMKMNGKYNRFEIGALLWADFNARLNAPKMYLYKFDPEIPGDDAGSFHSSELWFVFETLAKCWRPFKGKHYDLARQMCNYWTNFAKTGDPNGQTQTELPCLNGGLSKGRTASLCSLPMRPGCKKILVVI